MVEGKIYTLKDLAAKAGVSKTAMLLRVQTAKIEPVSYRGKQQTKLFSDKQAEVLLDMGRESKQVIEDTTKVSGKSDKVTSKYNESIDNPNLDVMRDDFLGYLQEENKRLRVQNDKQFKELVKAREDLVKLADQAQQLQLDMQKRQQQLESVPEKVDNRGNNIEATTKTDHKKQGFWSHLFGSNN